MTEYFVLTLDIIRNRIKKDFFSLPVPYTVAFLSAAYFEFLLMGRKSKLRWVQEKAIYEETIRLCSFNPVKGKPRRDVITLYV